MQVKDAHQCPLTNIQLLENLIKRNWTCDIKEEMQGVYHSIINKLSLTVR